MDDKLIWYLDSKGITQNGGVVLNGDAQALADRLNAQLKEKMEKQLGREVPSDILIVQEGVDYKRLMMNPLVAKMLRVEENLRESEVMGLSQEAQQESLALDDQATHEEVQQIVEDAETVGENAYDAVRGQEYESDDNTLMDADEYVEAIKDGMMDSGVDEMDGENLESETVTETTKQVDAQLMPKFARMEAWLKRRIRHNEILLNKIRIEKERHANDQDMLVQLIQREQEIKRDLNGDPARKKVGLYARLNHLLNMDVMEELGAYMEADLKRAEELVASHDFDAIDEAKRIAGFYRDVCTFNVNYKHPLFKRESLYNPDGTLKFSEEQRKFFEDYRYRAEEILNRIYERNRRLVVDVVRENDAVQETTGRMELTEEDILNGRGLRDITLFDMMLMDISNGCFSGDSIIPKTMMVMIVEAFERHKARARATEEEIDAQIKDVEAELKRLGYSIPVKGINGVMYQIFQATDANGLKRNRLVSRFTPRFQDAQAKMSIAFQKGYRKLSGIIDPAQRATDLNKLLHFRKLWLEDNAHTIQFNILDEFVNDAEIQKIFGGKLHLSQNSESHRQELLKALGQKGYDEFIARQRELLINYYNQREAMLTSLLQDEQVDNIKALSPELQNQFKAWEAENNPLLALEANGSNIQYIDGVAYGSNLSYNLAVPRRTLTQTSMINGKEVKEEVDSKYYDEAFSVIENSDVLAKFYKTVVKTFDSIYDYMPPETRQYFEKGTLPQMQRNLVEMLAVEGKDMTFLQKVSAAFRFIINKIKEQMGENFQGTLSQLEVDPLTGEPIYEVGNKWIQSSESEVRKRMKLERIRLKRALGLRLMDKWDTSMNIYTMDEKARGILAENLGIENTIAAFEKRLPKEDLQDVDVEYLLKKSIEDQVMHENSFDLPKMLKLYSYMSAQYAARQELRPVMEAMRQQYNSIKKTTTNRFGQTMRDTEDKPVVNGERDRAKKRMNAWFNRVVLGVQETKSEFGDTRLGKKIRDKIGADEVDENGKPKSRLVALMGNLSRKIYTDEEKRIQGRMDEVEKILLEEQDMLTKELKEINDSILEEEGEDIPDLDKIEKLHHNLKSVEYQLKVADRMVDRVGGQKEALGRDLTALSLIQGFLSFVRFKGLGWNLSSGLTNYMEGQIANSIAAASGMYFTPNNIYRANGIVANSTIKFLSGNKIPNKTARKLRAMVDKYRLLQDNTNEFQRSSTNSKLYGLQNKLDPFDFVRRVEYKNQAPIIISILLDQKIKDKNGENEVSVWDAMDDDFRLKEEYRTEENIKNWEQANGEDYFKFSALTKKAIINIHGDYDDLHGMLASEYTAGKALLMFKKWMARAFYTRFAKEQMDLELRNKAFKGRYRSLTKGTAGILLGTVGLAAFGPLGFLVFAGAGVLGGGIFGVKTNMNIIQELLYSSAELLKGMLRIPLNLIPGAKGKLKYKDYHKIQQDTGLNEADAKNFSANMAEASLLMALTALVVAVRTLLGDDDDDEKRKNKAQLEAKEQIRNLCVNKMLQLSSQTAMYTNPVETWKNTLGTVPILSTLTEMGDAVGHLSNLLTGNDTVLSGPNVGKSKAGTAVRKLVMPGIFRSGKLGFDAATNHDWNQKHWTHVFQESEAAKVRKKKSVAKAKQQREDMEDDE